MAITAVSAFELCSKRRRSWMEGYRRLVPRELLAICIIIAVTVLFSIHYWDRHQNLSNALSQPPGDAILNENESMDYSDLFTNRIAKNYSLLQASSKSLIMIYIVGIEGTGHRFFDNLFSNLVEYHNEHYPTESLRYHHVDIKQGMYS